MFQGRGVGLLQARKAGLKAARQRSQQRAQHATDQAQRPHRQAQQGTGQGFQQGDAQLTERPARAAVALQRWRRPGRLRGKITGGQHGNHAQGYQQCGQQGAGHDQGLIGKQLAGNALDKHHRKEHRHRGQGRGGDRQRHLGGPAAGRLQTGVTRLQASRDGFQHHDGRVDQKPDGQGDAAQRHDVETESGAVHENEAGQHRHRDGRRDNESGADIAQEQVQHQHRQNAAEQTGLHHPADRGLDETRLIKQQVQRHIGGQGVGQGVKSRPHLIGHCHRVAIALAEDGQFHRLAPLDADDGVALLVALGHLGQIAQADDLIILAEQDELTHVRQRGVLIAGAHQVAQAALVDAAAGQIDVLLGQALDDLVTAEAQAGQAGQIQIDLNLVLQAAADLDRGDAGHRLQRLLQAVFGDAAQAFEQGRIAGRGAGAGQAVAQDRVAGRVHPQHQRARRLAGQFQRIQFLADVQHREIHLRAPVEFQGHIALARARHRLHPAHPAHQAQRLFHRLADQGFDLRRRGADIIGTHRGGGIGQIRQQGDVQAAQRHQAEQHGSQGEHADRHRAGGRCAEQAHGRVSRRFRPR